MVREYLHQMKLHITRFLGNGPQTFPQLDICPHFKAKMTGREYVSDRPQVGAVGHNTEMSSVFFYY